MLSSTLATDSGWLIRGTKLEVIVRSLAHYVQWLVSYTVNYAALRLLTVNEKNNEWCI